MNLARYYILKSPVW